MLKIKLANRAASFGCFTVTPSFNCRVMQFSIASGLAAASASSLPYAFREADGTSGTNKEKMIAPLL
jgi:hypothetical protein